MWACNVGFQVTSNYGLQQQLLKQRTLQRCALLSWYNDVYDNNRYMNFVDGIPQICFLIDFAVYNCFCSTDLRGNYC